jgi:hypothetical protein
MNSPRIGEKVELKIIQNCCLKRSGKVWKQLKNDKMSINPVWVSTKTDW